MTREVYIPVVEAHADELIKKLPTGTSVIVMIQLPDTNEIIGVGNRSEERLIGIFQKAIDKLNNKLNNLYKTFLI